MAGIAGEVFKIALPGLLRSLGLAKFLRERGLRVPTAKVQDAVNNANSVLRAQGEQGTLTVAQWRAVEATQAQLLGDGIATQVSPK